MPAPRRRFLGLALAASADVACAETPPATRGDAPEPTAALRPEGERGAVPADARIADYILDARLDADAHRIEGTARITWRNRTPRTVRRLPFHLYMNAFRAEDTAWMREARGTHRGQKQKDGGWGYIDISRITLLGTPPIAELGALEAKPGAAKTLEWAEDDDPSTMMVELEEPVGPGESVVVEIDFVTQLPEVFARTGFADDFHMVAQWYPKIGVLDPSEGWQAHTFTFNSEFYADFGDYEVTLDVPEATVVGASGILVSEEPQADGRKRLRYSAEMIHDFAWAADPDFVEVRAEWRGIRLRQLMPPEYAGDADAHEEALVAALESMDRRFGPYPWSTITIIHPPADAGGAGGMEYPTLFTTTPILSRSLWWRLIDLDERFSGRFTTIHEFGHQYFQGLLASDEFREPWLDEGMNTMSNSLALLDWNGDDNWALRLGSQRLSDVDMTALSLRARGDLDPIRRPADRFLAVTKTYGTTVYRKTAATMLTLRNLAGAAEFDEAMRSYADTWRFRHPSGDDLLDHLSRALGPRLRLAATSGAEVEWDVADYLRQAMETTDDVDYALLEVGNRRRAGDAGWHRDEHGVLVGGEEPPPKVEPVATLSDDLIEAVVVVRREGAMRMPIDLAVEFEDGGAQRLWWDGEDRYHVFTWPGRRLRRAELDPDHRNLLEVSRLNNLRYADEAPDGDGLSEPAGDALEIVSLAILGGMGL
ncbi:MAG: M1 family metallopeptidase [Myxococcales bacterium]|nr:M1 family metallopeptidase [Myxococcales bacterium]